MKLDCRDGTCGADDCEKCRGEAAVEYKLCRERGVTMGERHVECPVHGWKDTIDGECPVCPKDELHPVMREILGTIFKPNSGHHAPALAGSEDNSLSWGAMEMMAGQWRSRHNAAVSGAAASPRTLHGLVGHSDSEGGRE